MKWVTVLLFAALTAGSQSEPLAPELRAQVPALQPVHSTLYSNLREPHRLLIWTIIRACN